MAVNHPLPISNHKEYELDGNPLNLDKFFEVNDFSYDEKLRILELDVGETIPFGGQGSKVLKRVD
jgi:hypothetical protein